MSDVDSTPPGGPTPDPVGMPPAPDPLAAPDEMVAPDPVTAPETFAAPDFAATTVLPAFDQPAPAAYPPPAAYQPPAAFPAAPAAYPPLAAPAAYPPPASYPPPAAYPTQAYPPPTAPPSTQQHYPGQQPYPTQAYPSPSYPQQGYPGQPSYPGQQAYPGQQSYGYPPQGGPAVAATVAPSNTSAVILLVISILSIIATGIIGPPSGVMAILSLKRNSSDPARAARTATRGWITFAINAVIGMFVLVWFLWWLGNRTP